MSLMQCKSPRASVNLFQNHAYTPQNITSRKVLLTQCVEETSSRHLINIRSNNSLLQFRPKTPAIHSNKELNQQNQRHNTNRRKTAHPSQLQTQIFNQQIRGLLSPTQLTSINRKINFTYKTPNNNNNTLNLNTYTSSPSFSKVQNHLKNELSRKKEKQIKNKICSKQFSFKYSPQQAGYMKFSNYSVGPRKISFIQQFERSAKLLSQKDSSIKMISQSKMASTTATQSFYIQNTNNDFSVQSHPNRQNISEVSAFKNNSNNCLLDRIPEGKQLGKTVILPNYSFGGIIEQEHSFKTFLSQKLQGKSEYFKSNKCLPRQWNNNVKGLIGNEFSQDLKHSIHCGPQVRLETHKFEMLNGFGRQIKQSTMSFYQ